MQQRKRKLIGMFATVAFMIAYSLVAMVIGGEFIVGRSRLSEVVYYCFAGVAWLPVVMAIIRWMSRPDSMGEL